MDYKEMMVFFLEPEAQDIIYMLSDYIQTMEEKLSHFGDPEDDGDKQYIEEEEANLAVAIRLHDKLTSELNHAKEATQ